MSAETKTFETIQQLKAALPNLPDDAVIRDSDGDTVPRRDIAFMEGAYAPYTVTHEPDATPAPLDPSKVKAGDTVTLTKGETSVRGPVTGISYAGGGEWDFRVGEESYRRTGRIGLWAVTEHQPAPEPEPLIEGRLYEVTAPDGRRGRAFYKPIDGIRANHPWVSEDETRYRSDAVTDVRPLVVIDPAAGWWAEIHNALVAAGIGDAGSAATIALATLGIEATS